MCTNYNKDGWQYDEKFIDYFADGWEYDAFSVHKPRRCADPLPQRGCQTTGLHGDEAMHRGQAYHPKRKPAAGIYYTRVYFSW